MFSQRIAVRHGAGTGSTGLSYLLTDHLGSTMYTVDTSGGWVGTKLYKAWGENRYENGIIPTNYRYTGQYDEGIYLYNYGDGTRFYDPYLSRFAQADTDVPESQGEDGIGYAGTSTLSPLVVDYHENQYLEQLNIENRTRLQNPDFRLPPVPTNPIAFDRYAYSLNNPLRYVDPSGHFAILAALALITPVGWVAIGVTTIGVGLYFAVPGVREAVTTGIYQAGVSASNSLQTLFAKGEYVPPGLSARERQAYRDAVHIYKDIWGLGAADNVPKEILDAIAEALK